MHANLPAYLLSWRNRLAHPAVIATLLATWVTLAINAPLWRHLLSTPELNQGGQVGVIPLLAVLLLSAHVLLLAPFAGRRGLRWVGGLLLLLGAGVTHFIDAYGVVIDPSMIRNALATDAGEASDLISLGLLLRVLLLGLIPAAALWLIPIKPLPLRARLAGSALLMLAGLAGLIGVGSVAYADLAPLMRTYPKLRYEISPLNVVYGTARVALSRPRVNGPPVAVGTDAVYLQRAGAESRPPLVVMVVGETARADRMGINGYARDTTPYAAALESQGQLLNFGAITSCGTNTEVSVPCMFSDQGRAGVDSRELRENLLDLAARAGYSVAWIDNQSGCKGVCARVPNLSLRELLPAERCPGGECPDLALTTALDQWLADQPRNKPVLLVLHLMGSHGPAYARRSTAEDKVFGEECQDTMLQRCPPGTLDNAYDDSIRATDHLIGLLARQLGSEVVREQWRPTLVYASDHGESLGEHGLYLHGMPYAIAPEVQKRVPLLLWAPDPQASGLDMACLARARQQPLSHDHLFHSMLGLLEVATSARKSDLDIISPCRTVRAST